MLVIDPLVVKNLEGSASPNKLLSVLLSSITVACSEVAVEERLPSACDSCCTANCIKVVEVGSLLVPLLLLFFPAVALVAALVAALRPGAAAEAADIVWLLMSLYGVNMWSFSVCMC